MKVNRILVTGGTGFTGSHLTLRLLDRGHQVVVLDKKRGLFDDELLRKGAQVTIGSIMDKDLVDDLMRGCDTVLNLAAEFRQVNQPKEVYWEVNVEGTRTLLKAASKYEIERFVHCSTCGVHGNVNGKPANETSPIAPEDYYQYTKYEGELVAQEYIERGLPVTIIRPAAIYGPGDDGRWLILLKRVAKGWFPILGDGDANYHPLYIDNLLHAFELAMTRDEAVGQTYLIADDKYYSIEELVKAAGDALDVAVKRVRYW